MKRKKRVIVALGGNALGEGLEEQKLAAKKTATAIVDLIEENCQLVIVHGNGPQVGIIHNSMSTSLNTPLYVSGAMSQTYIGLDLENALRQELLNRGIKNIPIATLMTQVLVDKKDKAFQRPTKPIGRFMTREEAEELRKKYKYEIGEDSGRGYRRLVPSPQPKKIIQIDSIKTLLENGQLVICCGGGGIPVIAEGNGLLGVDAVIDKDLASSLLAKEVGADFLIILTGVERVAINFAQEGEKWLKDLSVDEARKYIREGHFAPGSMLPKIEAAIDFAQSGKDRWALITLLEKAREGIKGQTGTRIHI